LGYFYVRELPYTLSTIWSPLTTKESLTGFQSATPPPLNTSYFMSTNPFLFMY